MKKYHEVASVLDGNNKRTGFLVKEGNVPVGTSTLPVGDWFFKSSQRFNEMVQDNSVQYLVWKDGLLVEYTDEELEFFKEHKIKDSEIKRTTREYFENDMIFDNLAILLAYDEGIPVLAGSMSSVLKVTGLSLCLIYIHGSEIKVSKFLKEMLDAKLITPKTSSFGKNAAMITIPTPALEHVMNSGTIKLAIDTRTARAYEKNNAGRRVGFIKVSKNSSPGLDTIDLYTRCTMNEFYDSRAHVFGEDYFRNIKNMQAF